ncbi:MAG TPA: imidazole glycerol phosphate synthase subunit HisH [Gemmatimonadaceae bacterium]
MRVTIFDSGAGNLHSLAKALASSDTSVRIEADAERASDTDLLVLPGVGAFGPAAEKVRDLRDAIVGGLPTIGICLGMQLLFETSDEGGGGGLGVLSGSVRRLRGRRVPHMGWNDVIPSAARSLQSLAGEQLEELPIAYYANSYVCEPTDPGIVTAWSNHEGEWFPAIVRQANVVGVQFHPEKSSRAGVTFLNSLLWSAAR